MRGGDGDALAVVEAFDAGTDLRDTPDEAVAGIVGILRIVGPVSTGIAGSVVADEFGAGGDEGGSGGDGEVARRRSGEGLLGDSGQIGFVEDDRVTIHEKALRRCWRRRAFAIVGWGTCTRSEFFPYAMVVVVCA